MNNVGQFLQSVIQQGLLYLSTLICIDGDYMSLYMHAKCASCNELKVRLSVYDSDLLQMREK